MEVWLSILSLVVMNMYIEVSESFSFTDLLKSREACATFRIKNDEFCFRMTSITRVGESVSAPRPTSSSSQSSSQTKPSAVFDDIGFNPDEHGMRYMTPLCCVVLVLLLVNTVALVIIFIKLRKLASTTCCTATRCTCTTYQTLDPNTKLQQIPGESYSCLDTGACPGYLEPTSLDKESVESTKEYSYIEVLSQETSRTRGVQGSSQRSNRSNCYLTPLPFSCKLKKNISKQKK